MNKNRYRIVFNKARNLMMAVAENTTSQGKGRQGGSGHPSGGEARRGANIIELFQLKPLAFFTLCLFGLQPVLLQAEVIADGSAPGNAKPVVENTANGIPLVQITAPSAAGVSHNMYNQFNVGTNGVILNNSQGSVLTQQGGYVTGNANLANGTARIILNEVTGPGSSSLQGYTEVAGQRAEVIIANPNGIVCNGCGFINTSRGILVTGVPVMSGGSLDSFRVTGGQIQIGAGGLNAGNTDQLDLITRSLQVNGEIWANNLNAVVGANQVDYATLGVQLITGDANKPTVGIDVALLGGMYANKIRLVGTEAGVGVNSLGTLSARSGDFSLDNQGNITLGGRTNATGNVAITTQSDLNNTGTLEGNTITTDSSVFNNSGEVLGDEIAINATTINNQTVQSRISANTSVDLSASGDIANVGTIEAYTVTTHSNNLINTGNMLGSRLTLNAANLTNTGPSAIIAATEGIDLIVSNSVSNTDGATIWSLGDLNAGASSTEDANGYLADNMVSFTNSSGTVQADGMMRISADSITNKRTAFGVEWGEDVIGTEVSVGDLLYTPTYRTERLTAATTSTAMLLAGGNMWLKGSITNDYSTVAAGGNISFNAYTVNAGVTPTTDDLNTHGFTQNSRVLMTEESRVGTQGTWQWGVVGGHDECYPCHWVYDWGWVSAPVPYAATITTLLAPSLQTLSASFTAGGNLTSIGSTISNLNNGRASATLGAIQNATPLPGEPNPPALNITLPTNGLFHYNTSPNPAYLIETDPRFASYGGFISSDYMLSQLNLDPAQTQKRLGDGFYEQKLVSDQVTNLTGRRFLPGYTSAEAEFKALMEQGLAEAQAQNLIPGVALTSAQVAALTHDIVWMVAQEVSLPDGTKEKVLVPQVFLTRLHAKDLRPSGSLIAAENINLKTSGTLQNSGTILGSKTNSLNATDIINKGTISSSGDTVLVASNDIKNLSGSISGVRVAVLAGHDVVNETEMEALQLGEVFSTRIYNTASITAADKLDLRAGHDVTIAGANVAAGGNATLAAGNNFAVSVKEAREEASLAEANNRATSNPDGSPNLHYALAQFTRGEYGVSSSSGSTVNLTSQIQSGGNLSLSANNDLSLAAAQIYAMQDLNIAGRNITLDAARDISKSSFNNHSSINTNRYDEKVIGSAVQAGGNITLTATGNKSAAQGNITISGSQISAQSGKVTLAADNNVTVNAVEERHDFFEQRTSSSSGFLSSKSTTEIKTSSEKIARGSSIDGDSITVKTGNDINVVGSDIVAASDLSLEAKNNITLLASENSYTSGYFKEEKKSGFMTGDGLSISYGDQKQKNLQTSTDISHTASNVGSLKGNVSIKAGKDYTQTGSNLTTPEGDINIAAQEVMINEVQNTGINRSETKFEKSGLTLALSNPVLDAANSVDQQSRASSKTKSGRMQALAVANALMSTNNAIGAMAKGWGGDTVDKMGGVSLSLSIGGSTSESSSTQTYSRAQGSNVTAGGNINIVATGNDDQRVENEREHEDNNNSLSNAKRGNITIQGSNIKAGKDTTLEAERDINLLAAKNTADQHSKNSSSSGSIGVVASAKGEFGYTASASIGRGHADGSDVNWTNAHVDAGNTLTLKSGRDTNLKGAVASGKQVNADIGGNLNIESLQDTSVYDSQQKSEGGSVTVGAGAGGSVNLSKSNINSNYASVVEQSGIKAGDGGYKVKVKGNTDLKGAVIAASDEGLTQSTFETGGPLTQSDIQNSADYNAEAYAVSVGVGSKASASAGLGEDSGHASSTTKSGIGVSTKTDTTGAIAKIFDANKVTEEVNAQVQITQSFSQQAPKAVADFSASRANSLKNEAKNEADPQKKQALLDDAAKWEEGGTYRVILHTVTNGLSGGLNGAAGALATSSAAPLLDDLQAKVQSTLVEQGMSEDGAKRMAQGIAELTSAGIGYAAGGAQGAASGLTVDTNNRQLHPSEAKWLREKAKIFAEREGISEESATERLTQQALKDVDYLWRAQLADGDDAAAKAYLADTKQTFTNDLGEQQKLFTAQGQQLFRPEMFGDTADPAFYKQFAQSGISRSLSAGLVKELKDSGISLKNGASDLAKAARDNPGMVLDALWSAAQGLPKAVKDSFIETGTAIGEGSAVAFNKDINAKLNAIYGKDVSGYQQAMLAIRTLSAISGAAGVAKVGGDMSVATAKVVSKKLDEVLDKKLHEALMKSGGVLENGKPLFDLKQLTVDQKRVLGELFGENSVRQIAPDGQKLARVQGTGQNGIDDLYKVNRPDVDYVVIEYKFVGDNKKLGSSVLDKTDDGKQGSDSWVLGRDRLDKSVGREIAPEIRRSFDSGRTETWVVTTRPDGSTEVQVLDSLGKPKPIDTSGILPKTNLSGVKP